MFNKIKEILFRGAAENVRQNMEIEYVRDRVRAKFPLLGTTMAQLKTVAAKRVANEVVDTAGTDGKTIYYNPEYFEKLSDDERVFVYAHEVMHVAFNHILRSKGRNHKIWNQATDAVINQMLKSEQLPMAQGGVDIADAINHSAEEMYEKLLRQNQEKKSQQQKQRGQGGQSQSGDGQSDDESDEENEQAGHDNHQIWKRAVEQHEKEQQQQKQSQKQSQQQNQQSQKSDQQNQSQQSQSSDKNNDLRTSDGMPNDSTSGDVRNTDNWDPDKESKYEKGFTQENKTVRREMAAAAQQQLNIAKNRAMESQINDSKNSFGDVGRSSAVLDWRRVLQKTLSSEQERWSYRRSSADNGYMARVEEIEEDDKGETEVLLDTSGSVSDEFLREFLRQLRPLLKNSRLRVGCFDHRFHPFVEIKNDRDINAFKIPDKGGTNWDLAVKSFTPKRHINKIIFTDGETPGRMPDDSTRKINVIWLVYGNEEFNPVCGRVIRVKPQQIHQSYMMPQFARQRD